MPSERAKIAACLASNVVTAALVFWLVRSSYDARGEREIRVDSGAPSPARAELEAASRRGVDALSVSVARFPPSTFRRAPLSRELDGAQFAKPSLAMRFDPHCLFAFEPDLARTRPLPDHPSGAWLLRTNAQGLRNDADASLEALDLRVLVAGDSQTSGYCDNRDTFCAVVESALRDARPADAIEVLNAAAPGYGFYQYLGTLERCATLAPDVYVVVVFGGNDFAELLAYHHRFHGTPSAEPWSEHETPADVDEVRSGALGHVFESLAHFRRAPAEIEIALQAARDYTTEIVVTCARRGIQPLFVYMPPITDVPGALPEAEVERMCALLALEPAGLTLVDRLAESWIEFVRWQRTPLVDLRPAFRASRERLYWDFDLHLSVAGHAVVARELAPAISAVATTGAARVRSGVEPLAVDSPAARALRSPGAADE